METDGFPSLLIVVLLGGLCFAAVVVAVYALERRMAVIEKHIAESATLLIRAFDVLTEMIARDHVKKGGRSEVPSSKEL